MFGKFMNNYYYGKSGKGDYNPEDLPKTRWQLFWEMLRIRLSALCRLNLIYVLPWLPTLLVLISLFTDCLTIVNEPYMVDDILLRLEEGVTLPDGSIQVSDQEGKTLTYSAVDVESLRVMDAAHEVDNKLMLIAGGNVLEDGSVEVLDEEGGLITFTREEIDALILQDEADTARGIPNQAEALESKIVWSLLLLIPCIFITGPWTAGVSYVTRNWARDEHAFIWSDMKDAMKENWKGALVLSAITAVVPVLVYLCWTFYGELPTDNVLMGILLQLGQMIPVMVGIIWYLAVTYAYPMLVTYEMKITTVIRNSLILAVGRLPLSVGVRLLHCVPAVLGVLGMLMLNSVWVPLIALMYYVLIGFTLSRFVTASYTNAQFDRFLNSRIEGAKVNQGLAEEDDDEEWDDEAEEEDREIKPWENGYADR